MAGGWASLGLLPELVRTAEDDFHWSLPSAIQDEAIPLILGGSDVMASAETGSGKTAAFALPILQLCTERKEQEEREQQQKSPTATKANEAADVVLPQPQPPPPSQPQRLVELSQLDRDPSIAMDPRGHGLRIQSRDPSKWAGCRATYGCSQPGRYAYSCQVLDEGLVRVGWSTVEASRQLGTDAHGYGYGGTGVQVHNGNYDPFPNNTRLPFAKGDVIHCYLEMYNEVEEKVVQQSSSSSNNDNDNNSATSSVAATMWFGKNGSMIGKAFDIPKQKSSRGGGGISLFPAVCLKNAECEVRFDGDALSASTPPTMSGQLSHGDFAPIQSLLNRLRPNPKDCTTATTISNANRGGGRRQHNKGPLAIVIEPTRDLAEQTYRAFVDLAVHLVEIPVRTALLVGGINVNDAVAGLRQNQVDVIVGTPPILASYVKKGTIGCERCRFFVLDEADELIATDAVTDIRSIYGRLVTVANAAGAVAPATRSRWDRLQVCFFSATLHSPAVRDLSNEICYQPLWIDLRGKDNTILPETVHHCLVEICPDSFNESDPGGMIVTDGCHRQGDLNKKITLTSLSAKDAASERIKQLKARAVKDIIDTFRMDQVLVFCRTNLDCDLLQKYFQTCADTNEGRIASGYSCRVLAGMRSMEERKQSLIDFKEGEVRILIATDVAARGIDIKELPFVINVTLPDMTQNPQTYVHRAGRVGRADKRGLCISLVATVEERVWYCQKGRKPPCVDTSDYAKGGNCIWYSEPECKVLVNELLTKNNQAAFTVSYPALQVPVAIQDVLATGGYGTEVKESCATASPRFLTIHPQLQTLIDAESRLQEHFWTLRHQCAN